MSTLTLDSRERVRRALLALDTDRIPTGPLGVHFCARVAGVSLREYTADPRLLAESVVRYWERFQPDAVWLSADTWVSAQAMGANVGATADDQPWGGIGPPCVQTAADIDRIPSPDPGSQGRYPLMLEALSRIVAAIGEKAFIVACFDQYPFSLAAALMGINEIMIKLADDPPMVHGLMERCLEYGLAYGRALAAAGADLLSGGDSPAGLIGPESYRKFAFPFERRLVAALKNAAAKPVSLHICGSAVPILPHMAQTGANVLEIDHKVDLERACHLAGPDVALWGNLDPVAVLAHGTPAQVRHATQQALSAIKRAGHRRFVLSSGCTLAIETPPENLAAMMQSANPV